MKERVKFVLEWERRMAATEGVGVNMSELCRAFGVSRETGYYWLRRYRDAQADLSALADRSRRPHNSPTAVDERTQDLIVEGRKRHPRWGPRKLQAWLTVQYPGYPMPSASCIGDILRRRGLTRPRRTRRRHAIPTTQPFAEATKANAVWCVDFKGKFRTGDGEWCHVLTLLDAHSRYLLRCEAVQDPNGFNVERIFDSAFQEFGRPEAIRSDNGPPFASTAAGGLTKLSVWWLKLDIRLQRIEPGKPQQNGRQERIHLTLEEVITPPQQNLAIQQRALDYWRREYNEERPHEALKQRPPLTAYVPSGRPYPCKLLRPIIDWGDTALVDKHGYIRWRRESIFVTTALAYEYIELGPTDDEGRRWELRYGDHLLGWFDAERLGNGLELPTRKRRQVSGISLG